MNESAKVKAKAILNAHSICAWEDFEWLETLVRRDGRDMTVVFFGFITAAAIEQPKKNFWDLLHMAKETFIKHPPTVPPQ